MSARAINFSAGPSTLPLEVLEEARDALLDFAGLGAGICEVSHRWPEYEAMQLEAEADLRALLGAGDEWALLFLQGGASLQFAAVPMNLGAEADYVLTGVWSQKALAEARKLGAARAAGTSEGTGFDRIPTALDPRPSARYLHFTSNNTIYGTQWREAPAAPPAVPVVCDASSDLLSRPLDLARYDLIYAGAQKNVGPPGLTLVLVKRALLERSPERIPAVLSYRVQAEAGSLYHTPPTFAVYVVGRVAKWLQRQGGLTAVAARNEAKARRLYQVLDACPLYQGHAQPDSRSLMNVTWRLTEPRLEADLLAGAEARRLLGLKGHRSVGGLRASLYNAMDLAGVEVLASYLEEFARERG